MYEDRSRHPEDPQSWSHRIWIEPNGLYPRKEQQQQRYQESYRNTWPLVAS